MEAVSFQYQCCVRLYMYHLTDEACVDVEGAVDVTVTSCCRRHFQTVCLDSVSRYLVDLQADSSRHDSLPQLIAAFKDLQAKLDRLL